MPTEREKLITKQILSQSTQDALFSRRGTDPKLTKVELSTAQSIPDSTFTTVLWDTETADDPGWFDPAANTRITVAASSWYLVSVGTAWNTSSAGPSRRMSLLKNGTSIYEEWSDAGLDNNGRRFSAIPVGASAGDYFEVQVYQASGTSLSFGFPIVGIHKPYFSVIKIL